MFFKVDHNQDGLVTWPEYKAQLLGLDPKNYEQDNHTSNETIKYMRFYRSESILTEKSMFN